MAAKKKRKKAKKGHGRKGHKRASTAKRGAAKRRTLTAGTIVTKKPSKKTLHAHKMHAKVVGKLNGKKAYKLVKNKRHLTAKSGYAIALRERAKALRAEAKVVKKSDPVAASAMEAQAKELVAKAMRESMSHGGQPSKAHDADADNFGRSSN